MKDQYVIACVESEAGAETVIRWAKHCAERLNGKGLMVLNVASDGESGWLKQYGVPYAGLRGDWKTAIDGLPTAFGGILAVAGVDRRAPRRSITNPRTLLKVFGDCKTAYLAVNVEGDGVKPRGDGGRAVLTLDHRRESKEKLIWASYLVRFLGMELTVALPQYRDEGLRRGQRNNLRYMEKVAPTLGLKYTTAPIPARVVTPADVVATEQLGADMVLAMVSDRRDRDVGDWLLGAPERRLLGGTTPTLLLNQRDDLYVLCD